MHELGRHPSEACGLDQRPPHECHCLGLLSSYFYCAIVKQGSFSMLSLLPSQDHTEWHQTDNLHYTSSLFSVLCFASCVFNTSLACAASVSLSLFCDSSEMTKVRFTSLICNVNGSLLLHFEMSCGEHIATHLRHFFFSIYKKGQRGQSMGFHNLVSRPVSDFYFPVALSPATWTFNHASSHSQFLEHQTHQRKDPLLSPWTRLRSKYYLQRWWPNSVGPNQHGSRWGTLLPPSPLLAAISEVSY